jgi:membrane protease YdiL (CAAX protease family)
MFGNDSYMSWIAGVDLHGAGAVLALAVIAWLLVGEPLAGRSSHRRLIAALDAGQTDVRAGFYWRWTLQEWALAAVTLVVAFAALGWTPGQLGLRWPQPPSSRSWPLIAGLISALVVGLVIGLVMARRARAAPAQAKRAPRIAGGEKVIRMLPHTRAERGAFGALAITAGVTEELVWRGFLFGALVALFPHVPAAACVAVTAIVFGWGHLYQGITGVLATGALGAIFAILYVGTGSLLLPVLLHALVDLRLLLMRLGP